MKKLEALFLALCLCLISPLTVLAEEKESIKENQNVSVKDFVQYQGHIVPLYKTFDDPDKAIEEIKGLNLMKTLSEKYQLEELNKENWKDYYDALYRALDDELIDENDDEYRRSIVFFDIYENEDKNDEIKRFAKCKMTTDVVKNNTLDLKYFLPQESYERFVKNTVRSDALTSTFNISAGIRYASERATNLNTYEYKLFTYDCTNFASQILEKGGVKQKVTKSENSGWWHIREINGTRYRHTQSVSWCRADTFAKYMGVGFTTKNNNTFCDNIGTGDFVGLDEGSDGDWNHIGFCTGVIHEQHVYRIAQHTNNYHKWTYESGNNWDIKGSHGATYGRIRR